MNSANMQKIISFLDLTADCLTSGYSRARNESYIEDEPLQTPKKIENNDLTEQKNKEKLTEKPDTLESIATEIRLCKNCRLYESRKNAAPGEGAVSPLVMVIGEGPGYEEDMQGRPFVGKAGQLLDKMLASINLSRTTNCFIANVVKCRPPENRDPHPEETAACAFFLERQISLLKPKYILLAGKVAAQTLLKTTESIGKLRGKTAEITVGSTVYPVVVTYHPAFLLRSEDFKRPAWEDLKLLKLKLESLNGDI